MTGAKIDERLNALNDLLGIERRIADINEHGEQAFDLIGELDARRDDGSYDGLVHSLAIVRRLLVELESLATKIRSAGVDAMDANLADVRRLLPVRTSFTGRN